MNIVRLLAGFGFVILSCSAAIALLWTISADGWSVLNAIGTIYAAPALYCSSILLGKAADLSIQAKGWLGKPRRAKLKRWCIRHCEPTGPARSGRSDDKLREVIQTAGAKAGLLRRYRSSQ